MYKFRVVAAIFCFVFLSSVIINPLVNAETNNSPKLLWKFTLPAFQVGTFGNTEQFESQPFWSPTVVDDVVYVGVGKAGETPDEGVYAIDARNGVSLWNHTGINVFSRPTIVDKTLYVSYLEGVCALSTSNGAEKWDLNLGEVYRSAPAVVDGVVYVGSDDGYVHALNASDGTRIWDSKIGKGPSYGGAGTFSAPTVADGILFIGSLDHNFYAVNITNGERYWTFETSAFLVATPIVLNNTVYFGAGNGNVYALNCTNGAKIWNYTTFQAEGNGNWIESTPTIVKGVLYIASSDDIVYALDAKNGAKIWSYTTRNDVFSSPSVVDGVVYVGSEDNHVYALNAITGSQIWNYTTGSVASSPAVVNGVLYLGSETGSLYAFDLSSSAWLALIIPEMIAITLVVIVIVIFSAILIKRLRIVKEARNTLG